MQASVERELPAVPAGGYNGQGVRLDGVTFRKLAAEYLVGAHEGPLQAAQAVQDARTLAQVVDSKVDRPADGVFEYRGRRWVAVEDAEPYPGLSELEVAVALAEELRVSSLFCDHPVWSPAQNVAFRVWHDTGHVEEGCGFDVDGELELFARQARRLIDRHGVRVGGEAATALFCESVYQLAACVVLGTFPDVQHVRSLGPVGVRVFAELLLGGES
jgi:hypothetical protein